MSEIAQQSRAATATPPRKRSPRTTISVSTEVDVDIEEFDDDAILARAAEIMPQNGGIPAYCLNVAHMAAAAYLAHIEGNPREFDRLAREIIGEIVGRII